MEIPIAIIGLVACILTYALWKNESWCLKECLKYERSKAASLFADLSKEKDAVLALEQALDDRAEVDRQIRDALGIGETGSTVAAVKALRVRADAVTTRFTCGHCQAQIGDNSTTRDEALALWKEHATTCTERTGREIEPTDEQVEALADVISDAFDDCVGDWSDIARAAYAHIGAEVARLRAEMEEAKAEKAEWIGDPEPNADDVDAVYDESDATFGSVLYEAIRNTPHPTALQRRTMMAHCQAMWKAYHRALSQLAEALAERQARPVKVHLPDVREVNGHLIQNNFSTTTHIEMEEALRYAASRAVIDIPADVPTRAEFAELLFSHIRTGRNFALSEPELLAAVDAVLESLAPWLAANELTRDMIVEKYEYLTGRETSRSDEDLDDFYAFILGYFPEVEVNVNG